MISRLFQKRISIWTIVYVALASSVNSMHEEDIDIMIDTIYASPLFTKDTSFQGSYSPNEIPNDFFNKVAHMSLPVKVQMLLTSEYQNGAFKHVELGGTYGDSKEKIRTNLILLFFSICFFSGITFFFLSLVLLYPVSRFALTFTLSLSVASCSLVSLNIYAFRSEYQRYIYPGYLFCTDTGMLIVEQGDLDKFSWLYYKDLHFVKDYLDMSANFQLRRILRTLDKMGQVQDFSSSKIDPMLYNDMVGFLGEKIGNG